jgi:hypothetical protein
MNDKKKLSNFAEVKHIYIIEKLSKEFVGQIDPNTVVPFQVWQKIIYVF